MRRAAIALVLGWVACDPFYEPPIGQIVLYVDTDALVPPKENALFDTLSIEVFRPGESTPCTDCTHEFQTDAARFSERNVSVVIAPKPDIGGYRVRVRLFDSSATLDGRVPDPTPSWVIETVARLPAVGVDGAVDRQVVLHTDAVGLPDGTLDAPIETLPGRPTSSLVGKWSGGERKPCVHAARTDEVCVPGGAFWMGNPRLRYSVPGLADAANVRRLVVLSPYFLDATEVTVGDFRTFGVPSFTWSGKSDGKTVEDYCTFTAQPSHEPWPVTCVVQPVARQYCQAHEADLPTEAQFEYAAGALRGSLYVWGADDRAGCDEAIVDRGGFQDEFGRCNTPEIAHPDNVGSKIDPPRRDRLELAGGTIYDLVGNVNEWTRDQWNAQGESCWGAGGVYVDPLCATQDSKKNRFTIRGGSYQEYLYAGAAAQRFPEDSTNAPPATGFRCARPDE